MCINVITGRFPRCFLRKAVTAGGSCYDDVLDMHVDVDRCYWISAGSYRPCPELVLQHISVVRLVRSTSLLHHVVDVSDGKENLL